MAIKTAKGTKIYFEVDAFGGDLYTRSGGERFVDLSGSVRGMDVNFRPGEVRTATITLVVRDVDTDDDGNVTVYLG